MALVMTRRSQITVTRGECGIVQRVSLFFWVIDEVLGSYW